MSQALVLKYPSYKVRRTIHRKPDVTGEKQAKLFVKSILWLTLLMNVFVQLFRLPSMISYLNDVFLVLAVVLDHRSILRNLTFKLYGRLILIYFFVCIFSGISNIVSPILVLWAFRNTFRGLFYILLAVDLYEAKDIYKLFDKFYYLQLINLIVVLIQYFVFGYEQDLLGGIFGFGVGNGAMTNTFNCLLISYFSIAYINYHTSGKKLFATVGSSLVIAALEEEKFTFVAVVVIFLLALMLSRKNQRKKKYMFAMLLLIVVGFLIFLAVFPSAAETILNIGNANKYLTMTGGGYNIPRFGAFSFIGENLFHGNIYNMIFGVGFGNSETSNYSFLVSNFYKIYGDYHYRWFVHEWIFIETGYIGFISFLILMLSFIFVPLRHFMHTKDKKNDLLLTGIIVSVCMVFTIWYNAILKADSQYLAYFGCAIGLIGMKRGRKHEA